MKDHLPQQNVENKKARKEFQNQYFVGGVRNPGISVKRLAILREAGQDILRLWNTFIRDHPAALEAARNYGTDRCRLDEVVAKDWILQLGNLAVHFRRGRLPGGAVQEKGGKQQHRRLGDGAHQRGPLGRVHALRGSSR